MIAEAVAAFLLFRELNFQSRLINALAPASFTCFLLHSTLLGFYCIPKAVRQSAILVLGHVLFTAGSIYLIAFAAHWAYRFVSTIPVTGLQKLLHLDREYGVQKQQEEL